VWCCVAVTCGVLLLWVVVGGYVVVVVVFLNIAAYNAFLTGMNNLSLFFCFRDRF